VLRFSLSGLVGLALAACSPGPSVPLFEAPDTGYMPLAQVTGTLTLRGHCLILVGRNGDVAHLAWPSPGTKWDREAQTITVDGVRASVGDEVTLIGGEGGTLRDGQLNWLTDADDECRSDRAWMVHAISEGDSNPPSSSP
jgi:hypothetical protein